MNIKDNKLWTALITPMLDDGKIDFDSLEFIVQKQEAAGNGILLLGSTGEGLAIDPDEKKSIVKFVSDLNPKIPVMAGVGGFNLNMQQSWIEYCQKFRVDAFLLVSPLYSKPGPIGMGLWFKSLLDVSEKPCMLYNIPSRTGVKIPPAVLKKLEGHPRLWSLKEASGNLEEYMAFRNITPGLSIFSGDDGLLPSFAKAGCSGLVSVASNVWPEATSSYVDVCLEGRLADGEQIWAEAVRALFSASNPIPSKILLTQKGWINRPALRLPLTSHELTDQKRLLEADKAVINWYSNLKIEN